jgi:hypothetical protein
MRVFILEDDPNRVAGFSASLDGADVTYAIDVDEARRLWQPPYDIVCLDHDLGGDVYVASEDDNTGAGFLRTSPVREGMRSTIVVVHSWNPDGAQEMIRLLREMGIAPLAMPFGRDLLVALNTFNRRVA